MNSSLLIACAMIALTGPPDGDNAAGQHDRLDRSSSETARAGALETSPVDFANAPTYYAAFFWKGPKWVPPSEWDPEVMQAHLAHIGRLATEGYVLLGGPFSDNSGGALTILRVESMEEAESKMSADPIVRHGYVRLEIRPWLAAVRTVGPIKKHSGS
ncbi:MAG: YciI family protein [Phycisphaerae bacterium]